LKDSACSKVILTGSVFENDEGVGSDALSAFSPYGLSKGLTWQVFRYYAQSRQINLGKFVIPNPFGPYEEPRFTHYLIKSWFAGETPVVNTPSYVRDNIHVSLLAKAYIHFSSTLANGISRINPSGYVESQGAFAHRVASEMRGRLGLKCEFALKTQSDFSEPLVRINTDVADVAALSWSETNAWDEFANFYIRRMAKSA
jgi:UDP-glucose 4-epimerase